MYTLGIEATCSSVLDWADFTLTDPTGRSFRFSAVKVDVTTPGLQTMFNIVPEIRWAFLTATRQGKCSMSIKIDKEAAQQLRALEHAGIWELVFHKPNN